MNIPAIPTLPDWLVTGAAGPLPALGLVLLLVSVSVWLFVAALNKLRRTVTRLAACGAVVGLSGTTNLDFLTQILQQR